jgi:hypothetical protein
VSLAKIADVTTAKQITLSGSALHQSRVADVYITVTRLLRSPSQSRIIGVDYNKIFYRANRSTTGGKLPFRAVVPLWEGTNVITVIARRNDEIKTKHTLRVLRSTCRGGRPMRLPKITRRVP